MADIFDEMVQAERFVGLVAAGIPPVLAGIEVGWSPAQTKARLKDPEFADIVAGATDTANATIEQALFNKASAGNVAAIQMWLFNREPDRWRDVRRIEIRSQHQVSVTAVESVKAGVLQLIREQGVEAMQAIESGDIIDVDSDEL